MELTAIVAIIGVLVAVTNVVVEVLKKLTSEKVPTNLLAIITAVVLTMVSGIAYFQISNIALHWYTFIAFFVGGFLVAYAAMFGFDKLKEIMNWKDAK